ncbi:MAG: hypothetical protein HDR45_03110 [Bacteroides sp.]|nr:hypothetical protein [Bacteroides sp.]MDE6222918.1 hypothetical protein [Muribaculaceae bacterium]
MQDELVHIVANYLTNEIGSRVKSKNVVFNWNYENGKFVVSFELVNTRFIIIANSYSKKKIGMSIMPEAAFIKIACFDFMSNFDQVARIVGEFERELLFFDETFPAEDRRQFIRSHFALLQSPNSTKKGTPANFNILSNKYIHDKNLTDDYGAKEIALDHLLDFEFRNNMRKNKNLRNGRKSK